jgi:hypothetical protein
MATSGRPGDLPEDEVAALYARGLVMSVRHAHDVLGGG